MDNAYLGPSYTNEEIKKYLDENSITYTKFKNEKELVETTAKLIFQNNVIGWFQGRMEWGPRALGARSILSNPCNHAMKESPALPLCQYLAYIPQVSEKKHRSPRALQCVDLMRSNEQVRDLQPSLEGRLL